MNSTEVLLSVSINIPTVQDKSPKANIACTLSYKRSNCGFIFSLINHTMDKS